MAVPAGVASQPTNPRQVRPLRSPLSPPARPLPPFTSSALPPSCRRLTGVPTARLLVCGCRRRREEALGNTLSDEDAEQFLTYLTVPYLRIPLVASFFNKNRLGALFHAEVQRLLERVLFEPLQQFDATPGVDIVSSVPLMEEERAVLGTSYGMLVNELQHAPAALIEPLIETTKAVVALCT